MHQWKELLIDFLTGLPISIIWKKDSYDFILVILDWLIKMVHYKLIKITINALGLAKIIIDMVVRHYGLSDSIALIKAFFSSQNFVHYFATSLALSVSFLLPFICKLMVKFKGRTVLWKLTFELLSILSRTIRSGSYQWPSLLIIMPKTQAPAIRLLN